LEPVRRAATVILCRIPYDRQAEEIIDGARLEGKPVVFDVDDLVFDEGVFPVVIQSSTKLGIVNFLERYLLRDEARRYAQAIERADSVIVSTDFLAQEAQKFGKLVKVHRNAFSLEMLDLSEQALGQRASPSRRKVVIGYASGTPTHDRDFQVAQPALRCVLEEHPEAELWIVGYLNAQFDWGSVKSRVRHIPFVPWQELPFIMVQFDINIAPLDLTSRFCRAKSEVKYIEAGLVAVPTIASRIGAFEYAICPGETGLLAETTEDWYRCLKTLVTNAGLRQEMGEQARQDVLSRYHPLVRGQELVRTLNEIGAMVRGQPFWSIWKGSTEKVKPLDWQDDEGMRVYAVPPLCERTSLLARAWSILRGRGVHAFLLHTLLFVIRRFMRIWE
jgi:glycosyltransferase involved in cell wall biosynthesis